MISCIAIGKESDKFYVQSCCNGDHTGNKCDCKSFGENLAENEAINIAQEKAKEFNVDIKYWYNHI